MQNHTSTEQGALVGITSLENTADKMDGRGGGRQEMDLRVHLLNLWYHGIVIGRGADASA